MPRSGLVLIEKPEGLTSFQALSPVKRRLGTGKIGHTGTLDKFAKGLLVLLAGSYSRLAPYFTALDKLYIARLRLGVETDTLDPEGEIVAQADPCSEAALRDALPRFLGPIKQIPPVYSAIHVDGRRAYERVRSGEAVEMRPREVAIHELELLWMEGSEALIKVRCSSGTYIRSLARDLAQAAGTRGSLLALERSEVGQFSVKDAVRPEELIAERDLRRLARKDAGLLGMTCLTLKRSALSLFLNGGRLSERDFLEALPSGGLIAAYDDEETLLGVLEQGISGISYRAMMAGAS